MTAALISKWNGGVEPKNNDVKIHALLRTLLCGLFNRKKKRIVPLTTLSVIFVKIAIQSLLQISEQIQSPVEEGCYEKYPSYVPQLQFES